MNEAAPLALAEETQNHQLVDFMDRVHAEEVFATPDHSLEYLKSLDYDQFEDLLTRVNGICREIPAGARSLDGHGVIHDSNAYTKVSVISYVPPAVEDRRMLLGDAFRAAQQLEDPEEAATLLGLSINIIHPFNDGNGRTSRYVYSLLTHGYNGSPEDQKFYSELLANTHGRQLVDLNPNHSRLAAQFARSNQKQIVEKYGFTGRIPTYGYGGYGNEDGNYEDQNETNILTNEGVLPEGRQALHRVLKDEYFKDNVLLDFLLESGRDVAEYSKASPDGNRYVILLDKLVPELSDEDILHLCDKQDEIKKQYAEAVIDAFSNSENRSVAAKITEFYRPEPDSEAP